MFDETFSTVVLIRKKRPKWAKGYLNGVGGKCEPEEGVREAMSREFKEETGIAVDPQAWTYVARMPVMKDSVPFDGDYAVDIAIFGVVGNTKEAKSMTDEEVSVYCRSVSTCTDICRGLDWMIPLVREALMHGELKFATINYTMPSNANPN